MRLPRKANNSLNLRSNSSSDNFTSTYAFAARLAAAGSAYSFFFCIITRSFLTTSSFFLLSVAVGAFFNHLARPFNSRRPSSSLSEELLESSSALSPPKSESSSESETTYRIIYKLIITLRMKFIQNI